MKESWGTQVERDLEARGVVLGPVEVDPKTGGEFRRVLGYVQPTMQRARAVS